MKGEGGILFGPQSSEPQERNVIWGDLFFDAGFPVGRCLIQKKTVYDNTFQFCKYFIGVVRTKKNQTPTDEKNSLLYVGLSTQIMAKSEEKLTGLIRDKPHLAKIQFQIPSSQLIDK